MKKPMTSNPPSSAQLSRSLPLLSTLPPCHCPVCCTCKTTGEKRRSWNTHCPLLSYSDMDKPKRPSSMISPQVPFSLPSDDAFEADVTSERNASACNQTSSAANSSSSIHLSPNSSISSSSMSSSLFPKPHAVITSETNSSLLHPNVTRHSPSRKSAPDSTKRGNVDATDDDLLVNFGTRKRFRRPKGVATVKFHAHLKTMIEWYEEFDDSQKNDMLKQLLSVSNSPQMHLLSTLMAPILHASCPFNCTDILYWLPPSITLEILGYLDVNSLVECQLVNKYWYRVSNDAKLWKTMCHKPFYRLSAKVATKQVDIFNSTLGYTPWKQVFVERYKLQQNWLHGTCYVRTFEGHTQGITCVQFDDSRIVSGSSDKTIKVWSTRSNSPWAGLTLRGHSGTVRCLHLDNNQLVSGSSDCSIKVWDLTEGVGWSRSRCTVTMVGHSHTVRCLQVGLGVVVSGSYDHTLKKWKMSTGECLGTLRGHLAAVLSVQFDNERIVSGSCDNTIKVWSFETGDCLSTLSGHKNAVTCIHFDHSRIVSGSLDTQIRLWDIKSGRCIQTLDWANAEGHTGVVRCLQADTWRIVSAADDKTLKVWSLDSGKRLVTLREHTDGVTCLQFNDLKIVSGSYDKTVKLWDFSKS